mmetsp:Transcript_36881/g.66672  ORF Transcript_36881/g.66672 Transcript_36881/m.66672 type:complete len:265 (-) Transcript_36881:109-903(-)
MPLRKRMAKEACAVSTARWASEPSLLAPRPSFRSQPSLRHSSTNSVCFPSTARQITVLPRWSRTSGPAPPSTISIANWGLPRSRATCAKPILLAPGTLQSPPLLQRRRTASRSRFTSGSCRQADEDRVCSEKRAPCSMSSISMAAKRPRGSAATKDFCFVEREGVLAAAKSIRLPRRTTGAGLAAGCLGGATLLPERTIVGFTGFITDSVLGACNESSSLLLSAWSTSAVCTAASTHSQSIPSKPPAIKHQSRDVLPTLSVAFT